MKTLITLFCLGIVFSVNAKTHCDIRSHIAELTGYHLGEARQCCGLTNCTVMGNENTVTSCWLRSFHQFKNIELNFMSDKLQCMQCKLLFETNCPHSVVYAEVQSIHNDLLNALKINPHSIEVDGPRAEEKDFQSCIGDARNVLIFLKQTDRTIHLSFSDEALCRAIMAKELQDTQILVAQQRRESRKKLEYRKCLYELAKKMATEDAERKYSVTIYNGKENGHLWREDKHRFVVESSLGAFVGEEGKLRRYSSPTNIPELAYRNGLVEDMKKKIEADPFLLGVVSNNMKKTSGPLMHPK